MKITEQIFWVVEGTRVEFFEQYSALSYALQERFGPRFKAIICADPFDSKVAFLKDEWDEIQKDLGRRDVKPSAMPVDHPTNSPPRLQESSFDETGPFRFPKNEDKVKEDV